METRDERQSPRGAPATAHSGRRVVLLAGVAFNPVTAIVLEPEAIRLGLVVLLASAAYLFLGPAMTVARELLDSSVSSRSGRG